MSDIEQSLAQVKWNEAGLVAAIAQDAKTGTVLMMAWMNQDALMETIKSREAVYYSRSRQRLWRKGEQSGHVQRIQEIRLDCDGDAILLKVEQLGGIACHTGRAHCFYRLFKDAEWQTTEAVIKDPSTIYP